MTENSSPKSIIIIGAGIAGLSTGIYAQSNGYSSRIYEMHTLPGGLMTAWKRKGYTIDGCIHWLTSSNRDDKSFYHYWEQIGLIQGREIFDPEIFQQVVSADGKTVNFYTDIDRLQKHLLDLAPEDRRTILSFCSVTRSFATMLDFTPRKGWKKISRLLNNLALLPRMLIWGSRTMTQFAEKFKNPFLRSSFEQVFLPEMSALGFIYTLALLHNHSAGYPIGGSLPMAQAVEKRYLELGGEIHYSSRVKRILVENNRAVGIELENGQVERADLVISAADGHATLYQMLDGKYMEKSLQKAYEGGQPIFSPILYISLGVKRTFTDLPACTGGIAYMLKDPLKVAGETVERLDTVIYNFDPTLAPQGKTVVITMIPTSYQYWKKLFGDGSSRERYDAEKQRIALEVIDRLEQFIPGISGQVEMADVATPLTFEQFTGNWQGSFEGWLPTPKSMMSPMPKTLPGLAHFYMVGQWVQPGGGLPSGVMTAREVIKKICQADHKQYVES